MNRFVLDASAVLAVLNEERGYEKIEPYFADGVVSSVNYTEILTKLIDRGHSLATAVEVFDLLQLDIVGHDIEQARRAAELRSTTKHLGLSLGDRCCLALAALRKASAVTADRSWQTLKVCKINVVR